MKAAVPIAALLALSACAQADPIRTASGKPDVVLRAVDRACVKDGVVGGAITQGWQLKSSSDYLAVFQRPAPPSFAAAMLTTAYGPPELRITMTFVPAGSDLRLVVDQAVISNAGTLAERSQTVRSTQADQEAFEQMARRAEAKCAKG